MRADGRYCWAGSLARPIHEWVIEPMVPGSNEFWIGACNDHGSETHTNVVTGESIKLSWNSDIKEATLVHIGGGSYEYSCAASRQPVRIENQPIDGGRIDITDTFNFGNLSTWTTTTL